MAARERSERLQRVIAEIDRANSQDPRSVQVDGKPRPWELVYSEWVTGWIKRLAPEASEETLIAARGQHIQRWSIPRENYPRNRKGYMIWRETLKKFHAEKVTAIMREAGCPDDSIRTVERIILKKDLKEPSTQAVEDALCLVFLEHQFSDLRKREPEEKMLEILRKSWRKMGETGRAAALKLPLPEEEKRLLQKALGQPGE